MNSVDDYFKILGVDASATPEELKKAYRELVKEWHPDRYLHNPQLQNKAQEKLREINKAYDQLQALHSNPTRRSSQSSRESGQRATANRRRTTNATPKTPAFNFRLYIKPHVASWKKNCLLLSRIVTELVKDPWVITALISMLVLAVLVDWFYRAS